MSNSPSTHPARRSRWLILLAALLAVFQIGAVLRALQIDQPVSLSVPLEVIAGGFWAVVSCGVLVALWQRRPRARLYAAWLGFGFSIYSLFRLLLFSQADYDRGRLPFLFAAVLLIVPAVWIIMRAGRRQKSIYGETNGRKPQN